MNSIPHPETWDARKEMKMNEFPECQTEDKNHMWGKWELFEKKSMSGLLIYTTTSQKRQCDICGLTQFLNEETGEDHATS